MFSHWLVYPDKSGEHSVRKPLTMAEGVKATEVTMDARMNEQEFVWQIMHERLNKMGQDMERLLGNQAEQQVRLEQIDEHVHEVKETQTKIQAEVERRFNMLESTIRSAVPDGDLEGHRMYHTMMMRRWNWMSNIKTTVVMKIFEVAAIAAVLWIAGSVWGGFKTAVGGANEASVGKAQTQRAE